MHSDPLRRELLIGVVAFGFGFLALPFAIYLVGQQVIGDYVEGEGVLHLAEQIWGDLLTLKPTSSMRRNTRYYILGVSPMTSTSIYRGPG